MTQSLEKSILVVNRPSAGLNLVGGFVFVFGGGRGALAGWGKQSTGRNVAGILQGKWSTVCLFIRGDFDKNYRLFRWVRLSVRMNCQEGITWRIALTAEKVQECIWQVKNTTFGSEKYNTCQIYVLFCCRFIDSLSL